MIRVLGLGAVLGAVIGLVLGQLTMPSHGPTHSCPSGAPIDACFYPPQRAQHLTGWVVLGIIVGLIAARLAFGARRWLISRGPSGVG